MSKNLKNVATVEVPEKALNRLLEITDGLVRMHLELIRLYEQESYLKKHHKAYLHVRDHAEAVCESDKHTISEMLESLQISSDYSDLTCLPKGLRDINTEGGIAAVVMGQLFAADVHVSGGIGASELRIVLVCRRKLRQSNRLSVQARATEIVITAILTVDSVPRVGEIHAFKLLGLVFGIPGYVFGEIPATVNIQNCSHNFFSVFKVIGIVCILP